MPYRAYRWAIVAPLALLAVLASTQSCGKSSGGPAQLAAGCQINSDCAGALICAFGRCHAACAASKDCSAGETCLPPGVCELPQEQKCSQTLPCVTGLTCAGDTCLAACTPGVAAGSPGGCEQGQSCNTVQGASTAVCQDTPGGGGDGGSNDGTVGDGGSSSGGDGSKDGANTCPNAQTQFGPVVQGDTNANFTGGVGVRTATEMLILSSYTGPLPSGFDGGASDAGGVNLIYEQAFDLATGNAKGPAAPAFAAVPYNFAGGAVSGNETTSITTVDAAIAPTGEIALLYVEGSFMAYGNTNWADTALYAAFLDATGGLVRIVEVNSAAIRGVPRVIWDVGSGAFAISYASVPLGGGNTTLGVRKFLPTGLQAGGDTSVVPTDNASDIVIGNDLQQGDIAASGTTVAVAYDNNASSLPYVSFLDSQGSLIGSAVWLGSTHVNATWVTVGGTSAGFTYLFENGAGTTGSLVTAAAADASVPDGGPSFPSFTFPGATSAIAGRAISDDTGGAGGAGVVLLYATGLDFAYVNADGKTFLSPTTVISGTLNGGNIVSVSNFGGSFGLALYTPGATSGGSTQMAVSGCH